MHLFSHFCYFSKLKEHLTHFLKINHLQLQCDVFSTQLNYIHIFESGTHKEEKLRFYGSEFSFSKIRSDFLLHTFAGRFSFFWYYGSLELLWPCNLSLNFRIQIKTNHNFSSQLVS